MLFKYQSSPIENYYYNNNWDAWLKEYRVVCNNNRPPVKSHKEKLGKQNYCYNNGEFKFWVWEADNYRIFVNNKKGICFEVRDGLSQNEIDNAWKDYYNRMQ